MDATVQQLDDARLHFRLQSREMIRSPNDWQLHFSRVQAALHLDGTEPVQGTMADMFFSLDRDHAEHKRVAFQACKERLVPRIGVLFEQRIEHERLPAITPLATRWSLLAIPTADVPTRGRRCSLDDSRKLALHGIAAFYANDELGQQAFLEHCATCHDKMAFMLARRAVLKRIPRLPEPWHMVGARLEGL